VINLLHRLAVIACTNPVTSIQSELSFIVVSTLKLIETHFRTSMLDDRLSDMYSSFVYASSLNLDKLFDKFVAV